MFRSKKNISFEDSNTFGTTSKTQDDSCIASSSCSSKNLKNFEENVSASSSILENQSKEKYEVLNKYKIHIKFWFILYKHLLHQGEVNKSFLSALPEDIRKEVEQNLERQKRVLAQMDAEV